ncbi:MAG: glycosyltransferase, partial [Steroidobacteraceae bacterium]
HIGTRDNKNLPRVIVALAGLPVFLVIVGPLNDVQLALLIQHDIGYENYPAPNDTILLSLYESADLISFPSTYEGFGMPILEAQAVGRAVLTSNREPMRSVAGAGAILVDPESVVAMRTGFLSLLNNSVLREQLISDGLHNVRQYTLESVAQQYQQLYEQSDA